jgi:hypothetical protein
LEREESREERPVMRDIRKLVDQHLTRATDDNSKLCRYLVLAVILAVLIAGLGAVAFVLLHQMAGSWLAVAGVGGTTSTVAVTRLILGKGRKR